MNGILIVDKPGNYTSRDIVNIVSKELHTKKVGHTGTLDPMATGVLVLCIGEATKLVELLTSSSKEYIAGITLGMETDTLDEEGVIIKHDTRKVSDNEIIDVLNSMKGSYEQEVPKYSAIKVNGKKLYEYAREGIDIELPKREVEIISIELVSDIEHSEYTKFQIKTKVSKGTYIRSLVRDIAYKLNTVGIMSSLRRIKQGRFDISESYTLEDIQNGNYKILSIEEALKDMYTIDLDDELYKKVSNGVKLPNTYDQNIVVFKYNNKVKAIYKNDNNTLRVYKMFKD